MKYAEIDPVCLGEYRLRAETRIQEKEAKERTRKKAHSLYTELDSLLVSLRGKNNPYWNTPELTSDQHIADGIYDVPICNDIRIDIENRRSLPTQEQSDTVIFRIRMVSYEDGAEVTRDTEEYCLCSEGKISQRLNDSGAFTALEPAGIENFVRLARAFLPLVRQEIEMPHAVSL